MRNLFILFTIIFGLYSWTFNYTSNEVAMKNKLYPSQEDEFVYDFVDDMPQFPGGQTGLNKYIIDNLNYPKRVQKAGISGRVYTECIIEKNGEVTNEKVYLGISRKLEGQALNLIKKMPNWIPGKNNNKTVRVKLSIPIDFVLN